MSEEFISKIYYYIAYFAAFFTAEGLSIWGQYFTLPFKNLAYWDTLKMALPFAWTNWFFRTVAIDIGDTYKLVSPTQDIFLLIISQFTFVLLINNYYLKQKIYFSDIVAFCMVLLGYAISLFNIISKIMNIPIPKKKEEEEEENTENKN